MSELYYQTHIFVCTNRKDEGKQCCAAAGSEAVHQYMKSRAKELGIASIRVNKSGCLGRCAEGPILVSYPEGTWHSCPDIESAETILQKIVKNA